MSGEKQIEVIIDLLTEFDEMGFVPTTTVPDPDAYAIEWKNKLIDALKGYRKQSDVIDEFAKRLKEAPIKCKLPWLGLSTKEEIEECIDGIAKEMKGGK